MHQIRAHTIAIVTQNICLLVTRKPANRAASIHIRRAIGVWTPREARAISWARLAALLILVSAEPVSPDVALGWSPAAMAHVSSTVEAAASRPKLMGILDKWNVLS